MHTTVDVANALGRAAIAQRVGVGLTTVSAAVTEGLFPASWYLEMKSLGAEKGVDIPDTLFRFKGKTVSAA